jgi:queuine tRNA-ribosyltransferase
MEGAQMQRGRVSAIDCPRKAWESGRTRRVTQRTQPTASKEPSIMDNTPTPQLAPLTLPEGKPLAMRLLNTDGRARRGEVVTPHGTFQTPAFMPVGTRATVKGLMPRDLLETGSEVCLANTYHLHLAPGEQVVKKLGGLHKIMGWDKTILTDSGGFQVFSLPTLQMDEEGVTFQFARSGEPVKLTPERSMKIQNDLGADIIMAFDVCVPFPSDYQPALDAVYRTERWLKRCKEAHGRPEDQALFGIVQGSTYPDLRRMSAELTCAIDLPGYAIGGVSVGEGHGLMMEVVESSEPYMPKDKPRYLMGVGFPEDIIEAVARGVDMFDCVLPSRYGRSGMLFTRRGPIRITKAKYKTDKFPIDPSCTCYTCQNFSRGYVHHLITSREILGSTLGTLHNLTFYQMLMSEIRDAIAESRFEAWRSAFLSDYLTDERREELRIYTLGQIPENASDRQRANTRDDDDVDDAPQRDEQDDDKRGGRKHGEGYFIATPNKGATHDHKREDKRSGEKRRDDKKPGDDKKTANKGIRRDTPRKPHKKK